jgi:acrosin
MLQSIWQFWKKRNNRAAMSASRPSGPAAKKHRARLEVEPLEDRTVPSILFTPQNGAENVTLGSGSTLGTVSWGVPLYTIYWGSYWATSAGSAYASSIQNSLNASYYNSPYLDGLHQYNINYRAGVPGGGTVSVFDYSDPANGFSDGDLQNVIRNAIHNLGLPEADTYLNEGIYFVMTPPGINSSDPKASGYHQVTSDGSHEVVYAWIGTGGGSLDRATLLFSHELVEAMSDPRLNGWTIDPLPTQPLRSEICDNEAQQYRYRLNGYLVQAYWSKADGAYLVSDGNTQNFIVNNHQLIINGDQLGPDYNDVITIDVNAAGGVSVTLNGEVASFDKGKITSIAVNTGGGQDSVYVNNEAAGVPLTITNSVNGAYVHLGSGGSMQGIQGPVTINNYNHLTWLELDDSGDATGRSVTVNGTSVSGLAPATVSFNPGALYYLTIHGGTGGNAFYVGDTPDLGGGLTWLFSGTGSDTVNVYATTSNLTIAGQSGQDYVLVGSDSSYLGKGTLANIKGVVNVYNGGGSTYLYVDDGADSASRTATLSAAGLTGLSPATIQWTPTASATGGVTFLDIYGSSAGSTYNVNDTPNLSYYTSLNTGAGGDTVNVNATTGGLEVPNGGGQDFVYVGNGTVAGIKGLVNVDGPGSTYLYVRDGSDTTGRIATLTASTLTGLSPATITWTPASGSTGGVTFLDIMGSSAGSTYNVNDTPQLYAYTLLGTGAGGDVVNVNGTTGTLYAYNGGGSDNVYVGNGTVAGIKGLVDVYGSGATYLYVLDASDTAPHTATLTTSSLTGLSTGTIQWTASPFSTGGVVAVSIAGSSASSTYNVTSTPSIYASVAINTGASADTVNVNATSGTLYVFNGGSQDFVNVGNGTLAGIQGLVNVTGSGSTYLYVKDGSDTTARTATLTASGLTGLSLGTITWTATSTSTGGVTFLDILGGSAGSTYNVTNTPRLYNFTLLNTGAAADTVNVNGTTGTLYVSNGGGQDSVNVGNGTLAGINGLVDVYGSGSTYLYVKDGSDTSGRTATLTGSQLTGLAPASIYYGSYVSTMTINAGSGNDTLTVAGTAAGTRVTFNGGAGGNTLAAANGTNTWSITGANAGSLNTTVTFSAVANLLGGSGVDTFKFTAAAGQVASINGGGAPAGQGDWLDYSAFPGAVTVNLTTGSATGVTGTVSNIQNVFGGNFGNTLTGSAQGNILVGGNGADTTTGGSGRSLLIGGRGNDTVTGGSADDIVIGGYTTYDQALNEAALMSILAEWQSADSYATRLGKLRSGSYPLGMGSTVIDDGGTSRLSGGAGLDWFFMGRNDTITDPQSGEVVN